MHAPHQSNSGSSLNDLIPRHLIGQLPEFLWARMIEAVCVRVRVCVYICFHVCACLWFSIHVRDCVRTCVRVCG